MNGLTINNETGRVFQIIAGVATNKYFYLLISVLKWFLLICKKKFVRQSFQSNISTTFCLPGHPLQPYFNQFLHYLVLKVSHAKWKIVFSRISSAFKFFNRIRKIVNCFRVWTVRLHCIKRRTIRKNQFTINFTPFMAMVFKSCKRQLRGNGKCLSRKKENY